MTLRDLHSDSIPTWYHCSETLLLFHNILSMTAFPNCWLINRGCLTFNNQKVDNKFQKFPTPPFFQVLRLEKQNI